MCSSVAVDGSLVVVVSSCPVIITVSPESYLVSTYLVEYPAVKTSILGFVCVKHHPRENGAADTRRWPADACW